MIMNGEKNTNVKIVTLDNKYVAACTRIPYYPMVIKSGKGCIVEDLEGKEYIDMLSGAAVLNTGHCHPRIVEAINEQVGKFIAYTTAYIYHEPQARLAQALISITPGTFEKKVLFGISGSDAIDGMIKAARAYTGRKKIISFIRSYHGSTYGSLSLSAISLNMRRKIGPLLPDISHINYPDCYRCIYGNSKETCDLQCIRELEDAFEAYIPADDTAAVIVEPIQGDGGIIVPPQKYMSRLYELCRKNGILFTVDEIQQGMGRTGKWFSIEHFGIEPDMVVIGKSLASGMPLSALVVREEIAQALESPAHLFSMGGHPVSCAAAITTIEILKNEKLLERATELGAYARMRFEAMKEKYEIIGDVRGIGLSIGVDLVEDANTKKRAYEAAAKICYRCWQKGLIIIFIANNVLRVQPPLIISLEEMDRALDIIEESILEYMEGSISDQVLTMVKGW